MLATPSSLRQCQSVTSTPLQSVQADKLRQKLFFKPLTNIDNDELLNKDSPIKLIDEEGGIKGEGRIKGEENVKGKETGVALECDGMGAINESMWAELHTLQESNTELRNELEVSNNENNGILEIGTNSVRFIVTT